MKTILLLVQNDLRRDWKRPWSTLLFAAIPLFLCLLIYSVFGGKGSSGSMPTLRVAVLDSDKDLLSRMLRSLPAQGDAAQRLRLDMVGTREEGLRLVEKGDASALVVLPEHLTVDLLGGKTNSLELYENPAQQIMPRIVREGVSLMSLGLSSIAELLGGPLRDIRELTQATNFPAETAVVDVTAASMRRMGNMRSYLFPPLLEMETVAMADYPAPGTNQSAPSKP